MSSDVKRAVRVAERIRSELMEMLLRGDVRDPDAQGIMVSAVRVSDDLQHARVFIRLVSADPSEQRRARAVKAMVRATGFLRRELGSKLSLRHTPDLKFHWDAQIDEAAHIEDLLESIRREEGGP